MRVKDEYDLEKDLVKYRFETLDSDYIWNEEANISICVEDRSVFVYGWDEDTHQDLSVLYDMFQDGVLEKFK